MQVDGSQDQWGGASGILAEAGKYRQGQTVPWQKAASLAPHAEMVLQSPPGSTEKCVSLLFHVICRPADASGFHAPIQVPNEFLACVGEPESVLPPLTSVLVLSTEPMQHDGKDYLEVAVDVTFIPQLFADDLKPPAAVWSELADGGFEALALWLIATPVVNLETPHAEYGCTLLYSASRFGNVEAVKFAGGALCTC